MAASNYQGEPQNSREAQMIHHLQNQFFKVVEKPWHQNSQTLVAICHYTGSLSIKGFLFSGLEIWLTAVEIVVHDSLRPHHSSSFLLSRYQASVRPWLSGEYNERLVDLGGTSKQWLFGPGVPHGQWPAHLCDV